MVVTNKQLQILVLAKMFDVQMLPFIPAVSLGCGSFVESWDVLFAMCTGTTVHL